MSPRVRMCSCSSKPVNSIGLVARQNSVGDTPRHSTAALRVGRSKWAVVSAHSALA